MEVQKIKNLENLLLLPKGYKVVDQKVKRLTAAGDNYGSLMLKLDITVETPNGTQEINTVAKLQPPNEFLQGIFNIQVTYRNEVAFYKTIVPTLQDFQREHGVEEVIDFTARYYGSRLNLLDDASAKVDSNAALVLENLKLKIFTNADRRLGFDLNATKLILRDLAYLHAVPLALKIQKRDIFDKNVKPYLAPFPMDEEFTEAGSQKLLKTTENIEEIKMYAARVVNGFKKILLPYTPRELWATFTHNDIWVNNIMLKMHENKPTKCKIVDYQVCDYGSPARDLVFFLFSSVQDYIIEENYDDFIMLYHSTFVKILENLGCDTTEFSFEALSKEIDLEASTTQFGHIAFMLEPIFAPEGGVHELDEMSAENAFNVPMTETYKKKFIFVVKQFVKRNWI